mgnify:CR=1 FL=1
MKSIFEEMGGTYTLGEDEMYYPDLELPVDEEPHYGSMVVCVKLHKRAFVLGAVHRAFVRRETGISLK